MHPARVVVMQVGHDDFGHVIRRYPKRRKRLSRGKPDRPPTCVSLCPIIARIDKYHPGSAPKEPHEVIHRMRRVMVVIKHKTVCPRPRIAIRIFDRIDLPLAHDATSAYSRTSLAATIGATCASKALKCALARCASNPARSEYSS